MHLEVLVEDKSGKAFLDFALQRMVGDSHTFQVHSYKGVGRIPRNLNKSGDASKRILLDQLRGAQQLAGLAVRYPEDFRAAVMVVCDLDDRDQASFCAELAAVLSACRPKPNAVFCLAIEEGEAWLLGDIAAVRRAYPNARERVLQDYINDSICGTWERLADAVFPGGADALSKQGWQAVNGRKSNWVHNIIPHMDPRSINHPAS